MGTASWGRETQETNVRFDGFERGNVGNNECLVYHQTYRPAHHKVYLPV